MLVEEEICPSEASDKIATAEQTPSTSDAIKNQSECKMLLRVESAAWTCLGAKLATTDC